MNGKDQKLAPSGFGSCCDSLKDALAGEEFDPLISVGEDGVLYFSVGIVDLEDEEAGMIDHPLFFCPFCGTRLQDPAQVAANTAATAEK